ncbi:MAG: L-malate glycosyltransferase [Thermoleophilaceae bacterium]|nr:L-malate glycosyltransferase [Thermoleophilaceae bacterium]
MSERLAGAGHDVTVATMALPGRATGSTGGVRIVEFDMRGNDVRGLEGDVEGYRRFVTEGDFDVVMSYAAQQAYTDTLLPVLDEIRAKKVLAPCGFSALHDDAYAVYFARLRERLRDFDALVFHSDTYRDIRFARDAGAGELATVIPNGADEREFENMSQSGRFRAAHGIDGDSSLLLTVGGHTGLKGHPQAMAAFRAATRTANGTLAIVANKPLRRGCALTCRARAAITRFGGRGRRVLLVDPPRPQVVDAYADADLFVFCSMVECSPIVLFEAMAAGLPFVSVDVGNAAEIAEWSGAGLIAPSARREDGLVVADAAEVGRLVDELLADPDRRREMGERGRRAWEERFSWGTIARSYERLYEGLAS